MFFSSWQGECHLSCGRVPQQRLMRNIVQPRPVLTCSVQDDSRVHAEDVDNRNSCNKLPLCLVVVSTVREPIVVRTKQIQRAAKTSSYPACGEPWQLFVNAGICFIAHSRSGWGRKVCQARGGNSARPLFFSFILFLLFIFYFFNRRALV